MMTRKLLQINNVLRVSTSTGRIVREIGEMALSRDWESTVAYSRGRDGEQSCTSAVLPVGSWLSVAWHGLVTRLADRHGLASSAATARLAGDIGSLKPDIVHLHNINGYFLDYRILFRYLSASRIPVVWTVHDSWMYTGHCYYYTAAGCDRWMTGCGNCPQRTAFPASLLADRSAGNWTDKKKYFTSVPKDRMTIVAVSEWMSGELKKSFMGDYDIRVIHNGIDTVAFSPLPDGLAVRQKYGLGNRRIILGTAGVWTREKGFGDFLELSHSLDPAAEVIVLAGVTEARRKSLPDNVVGIPKTADVRALAALYSAADVFVNPTWQDNYPTVNLEAISCGTPVVTYNVGGSPESLTSGTGTVVDKGDIRGLRDAVKMICEKGKDAYRSACREHALKNFRKEDRYAEYMDLYESLL